MQRKKRGLAEMGPGSSLDRQGDLLSSGMRSLSLGGERSSTISGFIPHFFEAVKLKSVHIPPTFLLLHSVLNFLDSKNYACYSPGPIQHPSEEGEDSSVSHLGRGWKLNKKLSAWLGQEPLSLDKHAFAGGVWRDLGCCPDQLPSQFLSTELESLKILLLGSFLITISKNKSRWNYISRDKHRNWDIFIFLFTQQLMRSNIMEC